MTLSIPYSFTPGTKAKAQEVNANFKYVLDEISNKADNNFSDLSPEAEKHFVNKSQLANCILDAPNGVLTYTNTTITIKSGLKILIPNGRNSDGTLKNIEYTYVNDILIQSATGASYFDLFIGEDIRQSGEGGYIVSDEEPKNVKTYTTWYSPKDNLLKKTDNGGTSWDIIKSAYIGTYSLNSNNNISSFKHNYPPKLAQESEIDGNWRYIGVKIANNVSINGSTKLSYDLSSYIPNDNYLYEIILQGVLDPTTTQNTYGAILIDSSFTPGNSFYLARARGLNNVQNSSCGLANFIIGYDRKLEVVRNTSYQGTMSMTLVAYRKVR